MPTIRNKPKMIAPRHIAVTSEGENVLMTVGNSTLTMHYEDALKISQWLRMRAKEAKRLCGDMSRHWSAIAVLDDLGSQ
jgi:hypothetical protein